MLCRLGNGIGPGVTTGTGNHRQAADADARATGMRDHAAFRIFRMVEKEMR